MSLHEHKSHVLGIESSCDDTGIAIIDQDGQALGNCVHSQLRCHLKNGGIIPVVAREYHLDKIDTVANEAFKQSGLQSVANNIDAIAVCTRPGMKLSLEIGFNYAKILAKKYRKPLIPIHHMQAHALMPLMSNRHIKFPFLAMLISGGHCLLAIAERYNSFSLLGTTRDDAPGDILDKFARRYRLRNLGLPYSKMSGGAAIELLSRRPESDRFRYFNDECTVPMLHERSCDFSFSGYLGCLDYSAPIVDDLWSRGDRAALEMELGHLCGSLQRVMLIQLAKKLQRALMFYKMHWRYKNEKLFSDESNSTSHLGFKLNSIDDDIDIVVSGGVAANNYFIEGVKLVARETLCEEPKIYVPEKSLCSDNGLMIAWNGLMRYQDHRDKKNSIGYLDIDNSVIYDDKQMELVRVRQSCLIGSNISDQVRLANFDSSKFDHPELRIKSSFARGQ